MLSFVAKTNASALLQIDSIYFQIMVAFKRMKENILLKFNIWVF